MTVEIGEIEWASAQSECSYYREGTRDLIRRILPPDLLHISPHETASQKRRFQDMLPLICWPSFDHAFSSLSVLLLAKHREGASHFFHDMISRWLLPQKKMNVELFFAADIRLPHLCSDLLSVAEVVVPIRSAKEWEQVSSNARCIDTEIRLGVASHYHARRILEFKGLSHDGKTAMIQEKISSLVLSRSKEFDGGIFSQMQHFLVTCREEFKKARDYHHISRLISNLYSVRKILKQSIKGFAKKRHVILKFFKTRHLPPPQGTGRSVLGILVSLNFLREHEVFEKTHLVQAIARYLPNVRPVEGSFFLDRAREFPIQSNYLEIEKEDGSDFTHEEIQHLRANLPENLKNCIEQLTHPLFMPRNEEEVLRNLLTLSQQLQSIRDLPQVIISFDEQKADELQFTLVIVRAVKKAAPSVEELFRKQEVPLRIVPERVRTLGQMGNDYWKEAVVLRVIVSSHLFWRADCSVNLYQARQFVLNEMVRSLGKVRDYNGGMIEKQNEVLAALKRSLGGVAEKHELILEKFFFSLFPIELRGIMEPEDLKHFFLHLLQALQSHFALKKKGDLFLFKQDQKRLFVLCPQWSSERGEKVTSRLKTLSLAAHQVISFHTEIDDHLVGGYFLQIQNKNEYREIKEIFREISTPLVI